MTFLAKSASVGDPARTADWVQRLHALTGGAERWFLPQEPVFLETGTRLSGLCSTIANLASGIEAAEAVFSRPETLDALADLTHVAERIGAMRGQGGNVGDALTRMVADSEAIIGTLSHLQQMMAQVKVVAINARIEASQLVRTGVDFTVFTRDIAHLAASGESTIAEARHEVEILRAGAVKAQELQRDFEARALPRLDTLAEQLDISLRDLRDAKNHATRGARDIPARLRACTEGIAKIVASLQIYDSTRQRLEHVEQALKQTAVRLVSDDPVLDDERRLILVNGIAELQALQTRYASDHYHQAVDEVGRDVSMIAEEIPRLDALCRQAFGAGEVDSLSVVDRNLAKGSEILADFIAIREEAAASLEHVVDAATRASDLIRSLNRVSADMRLMGLNASIKCGNMGSVGRVLSVIAQELQGYADQTRESVQTVAGALGRISQAALDTEASDRGEVDRNAPASLKHTIDRLHEGLCTTGADLDRALRDIANQGASAVALTQELGDGFRGKVDCRVVMSGLQGALENLAAETATGLSGKPLEEARRALLLFTEDQYTMVGERAVHDLAIDRRATGGVSTGMEEDADLDGILF